jgi:hypothetical protein
MSKWGDYFSGISQPQKSSLQGFRSTSNIGGYGNPPYIARKGTIPAATISRAGGYLQVVKTPLKYTVVLALVGKF